MNKNKNNKVSLSSSELTPLQKLLLEEVGKIIGAGARSTINVIKDASGRLPSGSSLIGTLLDPFDVIRPVGNYIGKRVGLPGGYCTN